MHLRRASGVSIGIFVYPNLRFAGRHRAAKVPQAL